MTGPMTLPLAPILDIWNIFLLVLVRITGMFFLSPIFGRRNIPVYFKAGFCFVITLLMANAIPMPDLSAYQTLTAYVVLIAKELLVGLMLGFISYLLFSSIYIAGQLIDMRIGFGMVSVFDPLTNVQIPITADFYIVFATLFMLVSDAHHMLISAVHQSFELLPIGAAYFNGDILKQVVDLFFAIFLIGFKIAAPMTVAILITDLALGIISRAMPQMNVFMLGMPVKIILGFIIMLITIGAFKGIVYVIMDGTYREIYDFLKNAGRP